MVLLNLVYWVKNNRPIQYSEFELFFNLRSFSFRAKNRQNSMHNSLIPQKRMNLIAPF